MEATADIEVTRSDRGYRAQIQLETPSGSGSREIEDARCDVLAEEAALVIALSAGESPPAARGPRWLLAVSGGAVVGPLPSLAPSASISVAMEWSLLRTELYANYQLPQRERLGDSEFTGRFRLFAGGLRSGLVVSLGRLDLAPSAGIAAYHFVATGDGGAWHRTGATTSWGPALGLLTRLRVTDHWAIAAMTEGALIVLRPRFVFIDAGPLHQPAPLALQVWVGMEFKL